MVNFLFDKLSLRSSAPIARTVWLLDAVAFFPWAGGERGRGSKGVRCPWRGTPRPPTGYGHPAITSIVARSPQRGGGGCPVLTVIHEGPRPPGKPPSLRDVCGWVGGALCVCLCVSVCFCVCGRDLLVYYQFTTRSRITIN